MFGLGYQELVVLIVLVIFVVVIGAVVWSLVTIARNAARANRNRPPEPPR